MFRVLLVDDEVLALAALTHAFPWQEYGFTQILTTTSSQEALSILQRTHVDAAFVDIRMPQLSGIELMAMAETVSPDTAFLIVSGYSDFSYAQAAIRHNALDYCLKPVQPEEAGPILARLRTHILQTRMAKDPAFLRQLLSDTDACETLLSRVLSTPESRSGLTLLDLFSPSLPTLLNQISSLSSVEIFFPDTDHALLLLPHPAMAEALDDFLEAHKEEGHFIVDTLPPSAATFQNELRRIRIERQNQTGECTGIVRLSPVSAGMTDCLAGLLSYVEKHYAEDLSLQTLARYFNINYTYLSQQFKKSMQMSFSEYLTSVRLQEACRLLGETQMRVVSIAEHVGYNDYHYFSNVFKKQFSMTPLKYRQMLQKDSSL